MKGWSRWHPAKFFIRAGHLRPWRIIIVISGIMFISWHISDLRQVKVADPEMVDVTKLPMNQLTKDQFIRRLAPEAQTIQLQYGVRASITLSQAALESDWGQSELAYKYNNFFGVKASSGMKQVSLPTSEYVNGKWIKVDAPFRAYDSWQESMVDHAKLLVNGTADNHARYLKVIQGSTAEESAKELVEGGYATDPKYAEKLIYIINTYHLEQYDYQ
nr:glycoside hydrolase family 73 protein [Weissella diestrammenae]